MKTEISEAPSVQGWLGALLVMCELCLFWQPACASPWTPLANKPPRAIGFMLLLSDGTVMAQENDGTNWFRLTPDIHGSYVHGAWTDLAPMNDFRVYYASQVLRDGRVFVAGGEYGAGKPRAEVYDPLSNIWTELPIPIPVLNTNQGRYISDCMSEMLPNGSVLLAPDNNALQNIIYDPAANLWTAGPFNLSQQQEASWVKLPDDSILTIDYSSTTTERFIPSLNQWVADAAAPMIWNTTTGEIGPAFLLPNGKAFFIGGNGKTALYTPSGSASPGTWTNGAMLPNGMTAQDAPGAMMVNGRILCAVGPTYGTPPTSFYEYDYLANTFTNVGATTGTNDNASAFASTMLDLPDGNVLYCESDTNLFVYQPVGSPLPAGKPTISSLIPRGDGAFHLTGTLLNGISAGAAYGDDAQMDSNFPLVRLSDGAGNVYYARTYNWSSTGVMTGSRPVTAEFVLPSTLPPGVYSLVVVANGISSDPVTFYGPVWVDFNYLGTFQFGTYNLPYKRLTNGVSAVASGGRISIKTAGSSAETMRLTKAITLVSPSGTATIGR
jgi:hypothetical protein